MNTEWLYQVRFRTSQEISDELREKNLTTEVSRKVLEIAGNHKAFVVCTFDAFCGYCEEAEAMGKEKYPLYDWTKSTINDPEKKKKHLRSFAFYTDTSQIYEKSLAQSIYDDLRPLYNEKLIEDLKIIDSNPENNPQPPMP